MVRNIVERSLEGLELAGAEIASLLGVSLFSEEAALIQAAARRKSEQASGSLAEVHAQVGLNSAPCPRNCRFCSFAACNGVFSEGFELPIEEAVWRARQFERDGANAIYLMATANYPFGKYVEVAQEVRRQLGADTVLVANVGDFDAKQAGRLKESGFAGVYHALRLGEGRDTGIPPEKRLESFRNAREAGLRLGTCVEPIGPEHSIEELVEKTLATRHASPVYSGAARRIPIPNTDLAPYGQVSEVRMAHILAVVRLSLGQDVPGNCTHEPNVVGAAAGSNLMWAEAGSNPRDTEKRTEEKRGLSVQECRRILEEAEWKVLSGPSRFFAA